MMPTSFSFAEVLKYFSSVPSREKYLRTVVHADAQPRGRVADKGLGQRINQSIEQPLALDGMNTQAQLD